jgi:hypothetical protein
MGVNVGAFPASAFIALLVAVLVFGIALYARRHGHLQSRGALIAIAILIALLVVYGMGFWLFPVS